VWEYRFHLTDYPPAGMFRDTVNLLGVRQLSRSIVTSIVVASLMLSVNLRSGAQGMASQIPASEYSALVDLYNSTGGPSWYYNTGWLDPNATNWYGISVSEGHVTRIGFGSYDCCARDPAAGNNLSGTIPDSLTNCTQLNYLGLPDNQLSGIIPSSLSYLTNLTDLWLGFNQLSGHIPSSLGNLSLLQRLHLEGNQLSGSIPDEISALSQLIWFTLDQNELTGGIPDTLTNLSSLWFFGLGYNQLSGNLPGWLGNMPSLGSLYLNNNLFNGNVPVNLVLNSNQLYHVELQGNYLQFTYPAETWSNINWNEVNGFQLIRLPQNLPTPTFNPILLMTDGDAELSLNGVPQVSYSVQSSSDLVNWTSLTNLTVPISGPAAQFLDLTATNFPNRFYRAVYSP
jgi:hypothetical protein